MSKISKPQNHNTLASPNRANTFGVSVDHYNTQIFDLFAKKQYLDLEKLLVTLSYDESLDTLVTREKVLLRLIKSDFLVENISNFDFFDKENPQDSLEKVVLLLIDRLHLKEALKLLQNYIENHENHQLALNLYHKYKSNLKNDYYYRYYGYIIMILQAFTTGLVLCVSVWFMEQAFHSVSGFIYYVLTLWALIPVFYINVIMIKDRVNQSEDCYTEVHPDGIFISHHSHLFYLSKTDEIFLYQDDNDYSFISLIRHLPFVPNFTYIRGLDQFSSEMVTLPLYGVSDGQLFKESFEKQDKIKDLNMIGVRVGQLQNFFNDWSSYFKVSGASLASISFVLFSMSLVVPQVMHSMYQYIIESSDTNGFSYIASQSSLIFYSQYYSYQFQEQLFYLILMAIGLSLYFARDWSKNFINNVFEIPLIDSILQFPIVRGGIVFISALFLYNHYSEYYNGFIPVILGTSWFYLVFVKTKYEKDVKELVAVLSAHRSEIIDNDQGICREHDIDYLSFPCETRFTFQMKTLFFNKTNIVQSNRCLGYVYKYDVQSLEKMGTIQITDLNGRCKAQLGDWTFISSFSAEGLRNQFESKGFQVEMVDNVKTWRDYFSDIFRMDKIQVICLISLFLCLAFYGGLSLPIGVFSTVLFAVVASKILVKLEWILIACFFIYQVDLASYKQFRRVNQVDMSSFQDFGTKADKIDIDLAKTRVHFDRNKKIFSLIEKRITYQEYENYLRLHPGKKFEHIPPFIHANSPREEAIDILNWHISKKNERFSGYRYGSALNEYCESRGLGVIKNNDSCGITIDVRGMSSSNILWDILSDGPISLINNLPREILEQALIEEPEIFYLLPGYFKKIPKLFDIVKIHHLLELKHHPYLIFDCHPLLLRDQSFLHSFILMMFDNKLETSEAGAKTLKRLVKSGYFRPVTSKKIIDSLSKNKELYLSLSKRGLLKNLPSSLEYEYKPKAINFFLSKTKMKSTYKQIVNGEVNIEKAILFDNNGAMLSLDLALNSAIPQHKLPGAWKYNPFIRDLYKNKKLDMMDLLKFESESSEVDRYGNSPRVSFNPSYLITLLSHPKIEMKHYKKSIKPMRRVDFQRSSPWESYALDQSLQKFSKQIRLAQLNKKHQSSSPSFARRLKLLKEAKIEIKDSDLLFHYSMLKDDWKHIMKSPSLQNDPKALNMVRGQIKKDISSRKVLLIDLPKYLRVLVE
ncbi:MAG: hypothetical protein KC646_08390 [Candidatus Cloacimonetes bacterium]|nr:hypothetical protein [Candidatus Cloacimonadota bacterium]